MDSRVKCECVCGFFYILFVLQRPVYCSIVVVFIIQVFSYFLKCCVLILLVCACPVYHCVICVYDIRSSDRNFPINTYLLGIGLLLRTEDCTPTLGHTNYTQVLGELFLTCKLSCGEKFWTNG